MQHVSLNIVVVEDDEPLRQLITTALKGEGHKVTGLEDAESINDEIGSQLIDLLITDLNLPGENGLSLARRFRTAQPSAGVMMVTGLDQVADKVSGYEHGADVYLTKPIDPAELIAAVHSFVRRHIATKHQADQDGTLILNPVQLTLQCIKKIISITRDEALLLAGLSRAPGHMLESWQILELLEIDNPDYSKSALEVRIVRLRKKIAETGYQQPSIKSVRGKGYQLSLPLQVG